MCEKNTPEKAGKSNGDARAFPSQELNQSYANEPINPGFTKREVIAKDLMAGLVSNSSVKETWATYALGAVSAADALLDELAKHQGS